MHSFSDHHHTLVIEFENTYSWRILYTGRDIALHWNGRNYPSSVISQRQHIVRWGHYPMRHHMNAGWLPGNAAPALTVGGDLIAGCKSRDAGEDCLISQSEQCFAGNTSDENIPKIPPPLGWNNLTHTAWNLAQTSSCSDWNRIRSHGLLSPHYSQSRGLSHNRALQIDFATQLDKSSL